MDESQATLDRWERACQEAKIKLQKCQEEMGLSSCYTCEKLLECELRKYYVKAVYDSMNKGTGGGFEF